MMQHIVMGQLLASPPVQWACNGQPWIKTHFFVFPAPAVRPLWSLKSVQDFENGNAFGPLGTHAAGGEWKLSRHRRCEGRNEDGFDYVERSFEATQQGLGLFRGSPLLTDQRPLRLHKFQDWGNRWSEWSTWKLGMISCATNRNSKNRNAKNGNNNFSGFEKWKWPRPLHSYCEGREIHRHRICKGQVEHFQWHSLANLPTMQSSNGGYTALVFLLQHKNLDFSAAIHPSIFLLARDLRTPFRHSNQFNCNKVNSLVAT
jgi:hypothetical protein